MKLVCQNCLTVNRVAESKPIKRARCGHCKTPLFQGKAFNVNTDTLSRHLQYSEIPLLIDFWADWCGPCKMMAPEYQKAAKELEPKLRLAKLDTQSEPGLAAHYHIRSIPTLVLFKGGKEVARQSGSLSCGQIVTWVRPHT